MSSPMWCLRVLFVLVTYICYCMSGKVCEEQPLCECTSTSSFKVDVDCHNAKLSLNETCRLCESIDHVGYLDLSENGLNDIPAACFANCTELEYLSLASNNLTVLLKQAFSGLKKLKALNLNNNSVIKQNGELFDPYLFEALRSLKILQIQKNRKLLNLTYTTMYLSNVANGTLTQLQSLYLDGVTNGEFGANFQRLKKLTNISFSGETANCYMDALSKSTFQNVPYTESLRLSHCEISYVDPLTFEPLKYLKLLNLSYNMAMGFSTLRNVSYGFMNSRSIEVLDYSKVYKTFGLTTQLNRCDMWFLKNTSLKEIRLNSNRMASFEINALALLPPTLEVAYLEDNKLTFGPYVYQGGCVTNLRRLELNMQDSDHSGTVYNKELHIKENNIDSSGGCLVYDSVFQSSCLLNESETVAIRKFTIPMTLKVLNARSTNLRYEYIKIPFPMKFKNSLESLDLSNNLIYSWTSPYILFGSLQQLNLSRNFCSNISAAFFLNAPNTKSLDASFNKLGLNLEKAVHESTFQYLKNLRILNLSNNWIERLPQDVLIYNLNVQHVDLSFNQIGNISFKYEHMKNLSTLRLQQNKISSLPLNLLNQMNNNAEKSGKNISIDLSDNILDTSDCENLAFLSWMMNHPNVFVNINSYIFYTGSHDKMSYADLLLSYKHIQQRCSRRIYVTYIVVSSLFIMIFIAIIVGAMVYRYRWRLRYLYYMAKARNNGYIPVRDNEADKEYQFDIFISYSTEDYQFVTGEIYNKLDEAGFSLCLHQKDFLPGNDIAENIVQAVRNSRQTLIVLSPAFLESKWCIYEFNMARMESIYSRGGANVIFVVMYEDVDLTKVSPELRDCLESESYLAFPGDEAEKAYFWQILIQALCSPGGRS